MATDEELKEYQDRATAIQNATRKLVQDIMEDETLPAQSFDDPINRHNLTQQAVNSMNQLEQVKQPIKDKFARAEEARLKAEREAAAAAEGELELPP